MAQRYGEEYGSPRSGRREDEDRDERYRGSREFEDRHRERQRSRSRSSQDEEQDVRFGRNVGDTGDWSRPGNLRDFSDRTSQGRHAGYGDYGQEEYFGTRGTGEGEGSHGGIGDYGGGRDYSLGSSRRESGGGSRFSDYGFGRSEYGRGFERNEGMRRDFDEGRVSYGRRDYRGNVGPGGYGYSEASEGPSTYWRGGGQDWASNQRSGQQYGRQYGQQGSFRGRGPKGYKRSDERLQEIICERLTDDPNIDASDITVTVTEAVVILDGTVPDRWTKYQVEELAEDVGGTKDVRNQLRTKSSAQQQQGTSGMQGSSSSQSSQAGDVGASTRGKPGSSNKPF